MSPKPARQTRRLALSRETLRSLEEQGAVKFGPQTSERVACCGETIDQNGNPITSF
ncbi:MAG TPA: hypothetical protein VF615_07260 [Longimicrobiaceae bacterium]|jgi:hypothetical protein